MKLIRKEMNGNNVELEFICGKTELKCYIDREDDKVSISFLLRNRIHDQIYTDTKIVTDESDGYLYNKLLSKVTNSIKEYNKENKVA